MMIRTLLLLLCAFFLSWGADDHIDTSRCGITTACFVRESCIDGSSMDSLQTFTTAKTLSNPYCDAIIQMRYYSRSKYRVIVQINATDSTETIADSGVQLIQKEVQFACTKDGPIVNTDLFLISDKDYKWDKKLVFCAFTLATKDNDKLLNKFEHNQENPTLEFTLGSKQSLVFSTSGDFFWTLEQTHKCNPQMITPSETSNSVYLRNEIDAYAMPPITCAQSEHLIITRGNSQPVVLKTGELTCDKINWMYKEGSTKVTMNQGESFNAVCGVKFCSRCSAVDPLNSPGCSPPNQPESDATKDNCTTAVCPENQWILKDGRVLIGEMECKQEVEPQNSRNAVWYLRTSNQTVAVSKAACFTKTVCWSTVKFTTACPEGMDCKQFSNTDDFTELWCPENLTMRWSVAGGAVRNTSRIRCHFPTGTYRDDNSVEVPTASNLVCGQQKEVAPTFAAASFKYGAEVGGGLGALLFIAALVVIGMVVVRRRRAKEEAQKAAWEATFDPIVKPPTVEEDMKYKKMASRFHRTPWLSRDRNAPVIEPSDSTALRRYDNAVFTRVICEEFTRYSLENRKTIFYNLTQFSAYANVPDDGEDMRDYGNFNQFWQLFMTCERMNLDCIVTWEMIFRMYRILFGRMMEKGFDTPDNRLAERMKDRLYNFARPILSELGWRIKKGESDSDTWMRFFVVRVLLFTECEYTMRALRTLADFKREPEPEAPLRAVIWQYIVQTCGGHKQFKKKHWKTVLEDPENKATDRFGTKRQHMLYALATARDQKFSEKILDETWRFQKYMYNMFTPQDQFWAYRGATEYIHRPDKDRVVIHYGELMPDNLADIRRSQLSLKYPTKTLEQLEPFRKEWMQATIDTANIIAESCFNFKQHDAFLDNALGPVMAYCEPLTAGGSIKIHHKEQLKQRAESLALRFDSDSQKKKTKKELIKDFITSFATTEEIVKVPLLEQMKADNAALAK